MNKQTIAFAALLVVLTAVVLFYSVPAFFSGGGSPTAPSHPAQPSRTAVTGAGGVSQEPAAPSDDVIKEDRAAMEEIKRTIRFDRTGFRNPMSPLVKEKESTEKADFLGLGPELVETGETTLTGYTVQGIVWSPDDPLALVNEQVVGLGEELEEGGTIRQITVDVVTLEKNGRDYALPIAEKEEL